jgi:hypothetical protein
LHLAAGLLNTLPRLHLSRYVGLWKGHDLDQVLKRISSWLPHADGITISGGEPFDQPEALQDLLSRASANYPRSSARALLMRNPAFGNSPMSRLMCSPYVSEPRPIFYDFQRIKTALEEQGHRLLTSEDQSVSVPLAESQ